MEIKRCSNCKYRDVIALLKPCRNCSVLCNTRGSTNNWEPQEPERIEIKLEKRPKLMPEPVAIYEHTDSEIPEKVRISFTNGTSAIYELRVDQPAPQIVESIKIIRRMKQGYVNQPMRRRRNRR